MAWTAPATPVTLTVITVSFYNVNIRDNLNQLRANTGSADPGAAGLSLESDTATSAAWVGGKVARAGDTMTGPLTVPTGQANGVNFGSSQIYEVGPSAGLLAKCAGNIFYVYTGNLLAEILRATYGGDLLFMGNKVWHQGNDGSGSNLDSDLLRGLAPGSLSVASATTAGSATTAASASNAALLNNENWKTPVEASSSTPRTLTTTPTSDMGLSIAASGHYFVIGRARFSPASTDGDLYGDIYVNGVLQAGGVAPGGNLAMITTQSNAFITLALVAGDTVQIRCGKNSGTGGSSFQSGRLTAIWCGP